MRLDLPSIPEVSIFNCRPVRQASVTLVEVKLRDVVDLIGDALPPALPSGCAVQPGVPSADHQRGWSHRESNPQKQIGDGDVQGGIGTRPHQLASVG